MDYAKESLKRHEQWKGKLAALELAPFVTKRVGSKGKYICEFQNIRVFFGALIASDSDIRILEPAWLRQDFCKSLDRLRSANEEIEGEEEDEAALEE